MAIEPAKKRAVVFFDGQNLFHMAKKCFGYEWPNYDPAALAAHVCQQKGWDLKQVRFYTGVPNDPNDARCAFWNNKLASLGRKGAFLYTRPIRHGQEKGIDVRIALDIVGLALRDEYDVAVIFSQDNDFSEVADEIKWIIRDKDRWIKLACAFPCTGHAYGIRGTDWIRIDENTYDACIDPVDYRPVVASTPLYTPQAASTVFRTAH